MVEELCKKAKAASKRLALASSGQKNDCLVRMADLLWERRAEIQAANQVDIQQARKNGLSAAMIDRLMLNDTRLMDIAGSLRDVASLPDPVGVVFDEKTLSNGMTLYKQHVPIGLLAVIYESRPNVTIEVASLALKTGNGIILRGGSETIHSNRALVGIIQAAIQQAGLPEDAVQFIDSPDRALVGELLKMYEYVDMLIPRGGAQLHKYCRENSTIPVITGGIGICHLFVDQSADIPAALKVIQNAKVQRPSVCNALDTVLVHQQIAATFIPQLIDFLKQDGVSFRVQANVLEIVKGYPADLVQPAGPQDFDTEWLSLVLGIKIVEGIDEAIGHITAHSTEHSDGILTADEANAGRFVREVDSAAVYVNASTRFTDGGQFGLGAEVAVSTQRLHARGPMGLEELTSYKWVGIGDYQVRD